MESRTTSLSDVTAHEETVNQEHGLRKPDQEIHLVTQDVLTASHSDEELSGTSHEMSGSM